MNPNPIHALSWAPCFIACVLLVAPAVVAQDTPGTNRVPGGRPVATLAGFVENRGQWDEEVLFFARQAGIEATVTEDALVLVPAPRFAEDGETPLPRPAPLVLRFPAARSVEGLDALPTRHHFIRGQGSASNVRGYMAVAMRDVLPGLDVVIRGEATGFAYDLHAAPGVEVSGLVVEVQGASAMEAESSTLLAMETEAGRVEQRVGASWQIDAATGAHVPVESRVQVLAADGDMLRFGFTAPARDLASAFVLDPSLVFATYVGGSGQELPIDVLVSDDGAAYLLAKAYDGTPTTPGALQPANAGGSDAWIGRLSADGATLEWATWLGGSNSGGTGGPPTDYPCGLALGADGSVVVAGHTWTPDFPTTAGSLQPVHAGPVTTADLFVSRLTPDGSALVWSTFHGSVANDHADAVALFPNGDVLVAGDLGAADPPATPGAFDTVYGDEKQVLLRITADGSQLVWQTYLKASGVSGVVIDGESRVFIAGPVYATDAPFPVTPGAFKTAMAPGDSDDVFAACLDGDGSTLDWGTYVGGSDGESVTTVAIDGASAVYLAGVTTSTDFPVTEGAFDTTGSSHGSYVAKLLPGGSDLVWSTRISANGGGSTVIFDLAPDVAGNVVVVGSANEANYPTTPDAFQPTYVGVFPSGDVVLTKFDAFGETLEYSTYFGGTSTDYLPQLGLDEAQDPFICLMSYSSGFPVTGGAFDPTYAGGGDLVVGSFDLDLAPWRVLGGGMTGALDTPNLAGAGDLVAGTPARISLRGAAPSATAFLVVGLSNLSAPLKGGTLVPSPDVLLSLGTNAQGAFDLLFQWGTVPAGLDVYAQYWIQDTGAPKGWSASNALRMMSQ